MSASLEEPLISGASSRKTASALGCSAARPPAWMAAARSPERLERSCSVTAPSDHFGMPALAASSICSWQICLMAPCASSSASTSVSSSISSAPASTMVMASGVPQTTRSSVESCSSTSVGFSSSWPSMRPMRTAPTGPMKGSGDSISAADAPFMPRMSCPCTWSAESVVMITCTSFL